ncbi:hypothetical protein ACPR111641_01830 [Acinetobacter pragensis]
MNLEETTQLYASVLRQLLPTGGYDASPNTDALAVDVYAHAKLLAQADLDGKRLLTVLEELPPELLPEYETEYGLPLKCTVNVSKTIEERIEILKWVRSTRNVLNRAYFDQVLKIFGVELFEFKKFKPMQCTSPCNAPVNTEQLRYKVRIVIPDTAPADMDCIIQNYFPGYLRIDVLKVSLLFKTSLLYPLYFVESVSAGLAVNDSASRPDPELVSVKIPAVESIGVQLTVHDVIVTHPPKTELTENIGVQLTVHDVVSRQLLKFSTQENISVSLSVHDVISKPRIKTSVDEAIGVSLSIHDVIREKI